MRLAGPIHTEFKSAGDWVAAHRAAGYSAAYWPLGLDALEATIAEYAAAARDADLVLAETGAWSNPIDPDPAKAAAAIEKSIRALNLAERLGARCCVNIAGSRHPAKWDGPHPANFSDETFDLIVQSVRTIVDAVNPQRTYYTLEPMPWIFPSTPDEYLALIQAIDRPAVAVHLDPVNMIANPKLAYHTGDFLRECFAKLGPHIRSCHAKDIILREKLTVHLDECRPGLGVLDYDVFLQELSRLDPDMPVCLEHLPAADEYTAAADHLRAVAARNGLSFR